MKNASLLRKIYLYLESKVLDVEYYRTEEGLFRKRYQFSVYTDCGKKTITKLEDSNGNKLFPVERKIEYNIGPR